MASALRLFLRVVEAEQRKNGAFEFINWLWNQKANAPLRTALSPNA